MSIISFVLGLVAFIAGIGILTSNNITPFDLFMGCLGFLSGTILIVLSFVAPADKKPKPIEYPASEYTLELKVIEYQGQKDTTYVITPRKHTKT